VRLPRHPVVAYLFLVRPLPRLHMDKHSELKALATKRQRARWPGYKGIGDYHNGRPKLVICLGLATFNALCEACGHEPVYPLAAGIRSPFSLGATRIWCQAHTGARGQNNRNSRVKRVPNDWRRMKRDVSAKA
jgi:hypothetical protein